MGVVEQFLGNAIGQQLAHVHPEEPANVLTQLSSAQLFLLCAQISNERPEYCVQVS